MKPLDPRLLRHAAGARRFLLLGAALGLAQTLVILAFAWLLADAITGAIEGRPVTASLAALAAVVVLRASIVWALEAASARAAAVVKSELRAKVADAVVRLGPDWAARQGSARLLTIAGSGLDALDGYFARYLPQLLLTAIATPILVLALLSQDVATAVIVIVTLPLIPVFMILIGLATQAVQRRQWRLLNQLATAYLDLVEGLATLKIFGRERRQAGTVRAITDRYRGSTMSVLRVTFVSGFVLELAGTLSVALVAVSIGIRLIEGDIGLLAGLFVLLVTPEAFLPLRQVGAQFHAAADGVAAAEDVFQVLEEAESAPAAPAAQPTGRGDLLFAGFSVRRGGERVVEGFDATVEAGMLTVLAGPSGAGKSSIVAALLGWAPSAGTATLGGAPVGPAQLAWAGQRPGLISGSVADNVALGDPEPDAGLIRRALDEAGLDLDPGIELGAGGSGLSGGQSQRVAIARSLYRLRRRDLPALILDEPSAALDAGTEAALVARLRAVAAEGRVVLVVSHRPDVLAAADRVVLLEPRAVTA
ncbi:thiol reductant ABC exporter subunit CydD [Arenivirga flava]|uniref:Thiol reductant ABC exporter subunit CydD n=1 Tax=Arenivirga flava TaxID=1930060 RepID=A0AA37XA30_9MICO|nr:thiol reductant ABC exporter subunit CydD [Arenivirga flava]GMA27000.1 hypothetical protein GCM10025874_02530 [Arenivirga flava]